MRLLNAADRTYEVERCAYYAARPGIGSEQAAAGFGAALQAPQRNAPN